MQIENTETQTATPDICAVPPEIETWLAAQGRYGKFIYASHLAVTQMRVYGWTPLTLDQIPEEMKLGARREFDNPDKHYGELRRGDAILVSRTFTAKEAWDKEFSERTRRQMEGTSLAQQQALVEEINQANARYRAAGAGHNLVRPVVKADAGVYGHVTGGKQDFRNDPELMAALQEKMAELNEGGR